MTGLYATETMMQNFHVYDNQGNHRYDMILVHNILYELRIYLCLSENTIRVNVGTYEVCTDPMIFFENYFNMSPNWIKEESFWN